MAKKWVTGSAGLSVKYRDFELKLSLTLGLSVVAFLYLLQLFLM